MIRRDLFKLVAGFLAFPKHREPFRPKPSCAPWPYISPEDVAKAVPENWGMLPSELGEVPNWASKWKQYLEEEAKRVQR